MHKMIESEFVNRLWRMQFKTSQRTCLHLKFSCEAAILSNSRFKSNYDDNLRLKLYSQHVKLSFLNETNRTDSLHVELLNCEKVP